MKKTKKRLGLPNRQDAALRNAAQRAYGICNRRYPLKSRKAEAVDCGKGVDLVLDRLEPLNEITLRDIEIAIEFSVLHCGLKRSKDACRTGIKALIDELKTEELGPVKVSGKRGAGNTSCQ